jgi:hypothetical protein
MNRHDSGQEQTADGVAVANSYAAKVKGTAGILPRGYPWVMLVRSAILLAIIVTLYVLSFGFTVASWMVILVAAVAAVSVLLSVLRLRSAKPAVFRVRPEGIRLGGARHVVRLSWQEVQEIRISPTADGALTDILLRPSARFAPPRFSPTAEVLLSAVPRSYRFLKPPLLTPLTDPIRYSVPLWGTTAAEVAEGLQSLAPDSVPILS